MFQGLLWKIHFRQVFGTRVFLIKIASFDEKSGILSSKISAFEIEFPWPKLTFKILKISYFWHFEPNFGFLVGLIRQTLTVRAKFSFSIQAPKKFKFFQEFFDWILIFRIILFFPSWTKWQEGKSLIFTDVDFFDILDEKLNYFRLFIWK